MLDTYALHLLTLAKMFFVDVCNAAVLVIITSVFIIDVSFYN